MRRALPILRCFPSETPELGVSDIARSLKLYKGTAHWLFATPEPEEGLVRIAAPVRNETEAMCAAIGIAGPAPRLLGRLDEGTADVRATADALSLALRPYARTLVAAATKT